MTGKAKHGSDTAPNEEPLSSGGDVQSGSVLRWLSGPAPVAEMCLGSLPQILATLCGDHGCRVLFGPTEDLTGTVLRVYYQDKSLAMFPRSDAELQEVVKWASGPTVLSDVSTYGDDVAEVDRRRNRRR